MNNKIEGNFQPALEQRSGAWGFITHVRYRDADGRSEERHSRRVRKGLPGKPAWRKDWSILIDSLWMPEKLNWWIGVTFSLGSVLFALGSLLFLFPELAQAWSVDEAGANLTFFVGSIPFTMAAYMQFFQACNAETVLAESSGQDRYRWIAWRPGEAGWLSCAFQFAGTILFNINTFNALQPIAEWWQQDLEIWAPNITGSILFFASGYLAWIERRAGSSITHSTISSRDMTLRVIPCRR